MRRSFKPEFRQLNRSRPYSFKKLWSKVQDIMAHNIGWLAADFTTNDLWLYARRRGWIQETSRGTLIVDVP
jgi:hypothetical protein